MSKRRHPPLTANFRDDPRFLKQINCRADGGMRRDRREVAEVATRLVRVFPRPGPAWGADPIPQSAVVFRKLNDQPEPAAPSAARRSRREREQTRQKASRHGGVAGATTVEFAKQTPLRVAHAGRLCPECGALRGEDRLQRDRAVRLQAGQRVFVSRAPGRSSMPARVCAEPRCHRAARPETHANRSIRVAGARAWWRRSSID